MTRYGFYSQTAVNKGCGAWDWVTPDGNIVKVTAVCRNKFGNEYKWPDKKFVSIVTHIKD